MSHPRCVLSELSVLWWEMLTIHSPNYWQVGLVGGWESNSRSWAIRTFKRDTFDLSYLFPWQTHLYIFARCQPTFDQDPRSVANKPSGKKAFSHLRRSYAFCFRRWRETEEANHPAGRTSLTRATREERGERRKESRLRQSHGSHCLPIDPEY